MKHGPAHTDALAMVARYAAEHLARFDAIDLDDTTQVDAALDTYCDWRRPGSAHLRGVIRADAVEIARHMIEGTAHGNA